MKRIVVVGGCVAIGLIVWLLSVNAGGRHAAPRAGLRENTSETRETAPDARGPEARTEGTKGSKGTEGTKPRRVAVYGTVSAADGPVWGFDVAAYPDGKHSYVAEDSTDVKGRYRLSLPGPGTYEIEVRTEVPSLPRVTRRTVTVDDDTRLDILLDTGTVLAGVARDEAGKPVPRVWIYALDEPVEERDTPYETATALQDASRGYAQTDAAGRFEIAGLNPRNYFVLQVADVFWALRKPDGPVRGTPIEVELQRGRRLRVHTLDARTGRPVERFQVRSGGAWVDANNTEVAWVPGPQWGPLEIKAAGYTTAEFRSTWRQHRGVYYLRALMVKPGEPNVTLRVERADGTAYPGHVSLLAQRQEPGLKYVVGSRKLRMRLPPGKWALFITLDRVAGSSAQIMMPLEVGENDTWDGRLVLPPVGTLRLRRPAGGARYVDLHGPGWVPGMTKDGAMSIRPFPSRRVVWVDTGADVVELDVVAGTWRFHVEGARSVDVPAGGSAELVMPAR